MYHIIEDGKRKHIYRNNNRIYTPDVYISRYRIFWIRCLASSTVDLHFTRVYETYNIHVYTVAKSCYAYFGFFIVPKVSHNKKMKKARWKNIFHLQFLNSLLNSQYDDNMTLYNLSFYLRIFILNKRDLFLLEKKKEESERRNFQKIYVLK